jgi:NADP-dependent 3-hydroxy acid dehydrogenase YdfG
MRKVLRDLRGLKVGIRGFSKSLRKEVNPLGIRVSPIEPREVGTEMQDATPEEQEKAELELTMLTSEDIPRSVMYVLTQPDRCDVAEPAGQVGQELYGVGLALILATRTFHR